MKKLGALCLLGAAWLGSAWADDMPSPFYRPEVSGAVVSTFPTFESGRVPFHITTKDGLEIGYEVFALFALPGQHMSVQASERVTPRAEANLSFRRVGDTLEWHAPETPGFYPVTLESPTGTQMTLNLFVMRPASEMVGERLGDYVIGSYPDDPYRDLDAYLPPEGFVEVTPELHDVAISPHFTLGQFLCKQDSGWPKFVHVNERLVAKLERLLEAVNNAGIETDSFVVMSGFRTPHYNRAIGNGRHSRHVFGGAADIYIDVAPRDGIMDDLNGDGRLDEGDAAWLYRFVDDLSHQPEWRDFHGGLGQYGSTAAHGPFVHVDERGWRARWSG